MNRYSFLWFVAADRVKVVVNAMPSCAYWDPTEAGCPSFLPELHYAAPDVGLLRCWIIKRIDSIAVPHLGDSAGAAEKWDVFQMTPRFIEAADGTITKPRNLGTKVFNRLGQFILNNPDLNQDSQGRPWVGMPMSFAAVAEMYPTAADRYLRPQQPAAGGGTEPVPGSKPQLNPTPSGIDSEVGASVDYRPTNQQILDDDDIPDELWPSET